MKSPIQVIKDMVKKYPNNQQLGEYDIPALPIGNDQPSYGVYAS